MTSRARVLSIVGTRPEAIKMAPVIAAIQRHPAMEQTVVLSGQHREMLHSALAIFGIKADIDLTLMRHDQTLGDLSARALTAFDHLFARERAQRIIVQGDTTTAFVAALAAFYRHIEVAHVEAGLRTDDPRNPFPEEINRRFIDQLASVHFAPTAHAAENLRREGVAEARIFITGNTGIDALLDVAGRDGNLPVGVAAAQARGLRMLLVTAHRRENFGAPLADICRALRVLVERNRDVYVVYPVHPNPNVQRVVQGSLGGCERIQLMGPVDYELFVALMKGATLILTDSGGIQEEAPSLGKPVLVLRSTTERVEAVEAGTARVVGTDPDAITMAAEQLLRDPSAYARMSGRPNPYGDGHASERIVDVLAALDARGQSR